MVLLRFPAPRILLLAIVLMSACNRVAVPPPSGPIGAPLTFQPTRLPAAAVDASTATAAVALATRAPTKQTSTLVPLPTVTPAPFASPKPPAPTPQATAVATSTATVPQQAAPIPDIDIVMDNRDAGVSTAGTWFVGDGGASYNGDCIWAPRGIGNVAYYRPALPETGTYAVYGWWCGDPNHDQTQRARIEIHWTQGRFAPHSVEVNLQENAGAWNLLGHYYLSPQAMVLMAGNFDGNVAVDAFRFVYLSPERVEVTPTPIPTPFPWTNHPPSPLEQLTAGDLTARLGIVQPRLSYIHTPILSSQQQVFDDCAVFPRAGCGGQRRGWRVVVGYQEWSVAYRVAEDYRHVSLESGEALRDRQWLYLAGTGPNASLRVDYYVYEAHTWNLGLIDSEQKAALQRPLVDEVGAFLRGLAERYGPVTLNTEDGLALRLYGYGTQAELSAEDAAALAERARAWLAELP